TSSTITGGAARRAAMSTSVGAGTSPVGAAMAAIPFSEDGTAMAGMEAIAAIAAPTRAAPPKAAPASAGGVRRGPARRGAQSDVGAAVTEASLLAPGVLLRLCNMAFMGRQ